MLGIFLFFFLSIFTHSSGLEAPPLVVMPYSQLGYPQKLSSNEVAWILQKTMDDLYGKVFVDMGDVTDLMHGHVIFTPIESVQIDQNFNPFNVPNSEFVTAHPELEPVAILFHSQEYDFLRKGMPYVGPFGELDSENRNWVLFLKDIGVFKRGQFVDANELDRKDGRPHTITLDDLHRDHFGFEWGDWETSIYFFRVECSDSDQFADQTNTNLLEIKNNLINERVCINLTSFYCRNHSDDSKHCGGEPIALYNIFKNWQPPATH